MRSVGECEGSACTCLQLYCLEFLDNLVAEIQLSSVAACCVVGSGVVGNLSGSGVSIVNHTLGRNLCLVDGDTLGSLESNVLGDVTCSNIDSLVPRQITCYEYVEVVVAVVLHDTYRVLTLSIGSACVEHLTVLSLNNCVSHGLLACGYSTTYLLGFTGNTEEDCGTRVALACLIGIIG